MKNINYNEVVNEIESILSSDSRFIKRQKGVQLLRYASYKSTIDPKWLSESKWGTQIDLYAPFYNRDSAHVLVVLDDIDEWGIKTRIEFDPMNGDGESNVFFGRIQTSDQFYQLMIMLGVFKDE